MSAYIDNLNPFLIQFTSGFGIRWYGLAYLTGFVLGYLLIYWFAGREKTTLKQESVGDFITYIALGTMIGGRLGYCLFYQPKLFTTFSHIQIPYLGWKIPMWDALAVWNGGMASHGGMIGIAMGCFLYARKYRHNFLHLFDLTVTAGSAAVIFGRIANFINGELYGRACDGSCFWPVKFPDEMNRWLTDPGYEEPLKKLYIVAEKVSPVYHWGVSLTPDQKTWNEWVLRFNSGGRENIEAFVNQIYAQIHSGNHNLLELLGTVLIARHPSQLYQAAMEGLFVLLALLFIWRKPRKPGVLTAWWGILYACMRILGEQFRMPDTQIGYQWLGMTRGQWLSVAMLIIFIAFLNFVRRSQAQPMGGWGKGSQ